MDTAKNIIEYIETIWNILKSGGVWINYGPLLYHWAEMEGEMSIEISYQEVRDIIKAIGFVIEKQDIRKSTYTSNKKSMMQVVYNCVHFIAIKPSTFNKK